MKQSAGILVYRKKSNKVEVLLAHPGGPFWAKKDSWSIPKGELEENEDHIQAAKKMKIIFKLPSVSLRKNWDLIRLMESSLN
jgi:predicted NUDIX family NTP pyrophosphohydrolase